MTCKGCGQEITAVGRRQYCSDECAKKARWREHRQALNLRRKREREDIVHSYGGKCCRCGFDDDRALQIDHVNGGGNAERRELKWRLFYREVRSNPHNYQILCANCNWIKRAENDES